MRLTWYGHAAFLVETQGVRLILDPYKSPDSGGYLPIDEPADIVVISHINDRYHSHLGQIVPPFEVIPGLEIPIPAGTTSRGIRFEALKVFESPEKLPGDEVSIVHFRVEGLHLVFLGDLGHSLDHTEIEPLQEADVVLVPAGGKPTLDFPEMRPLLDAIRPRLIVPMHFKTPKINLNIQPVERFLQEFPDYPVDRPNSSHVELSRESLPDEPRILLLEHAR
ncbi:MAG: MBL fold metallo-hydrolase [Isosphaeraceae bacterium]